MVAYLKEEMISATEMVKSFKASLNKVIEKKTEKLAIMKNNKPQAIIISVEEYEKLKEVYDYAERLEILKTIERRKKSGEFVSFDSVLQEAGLDKNALCC